MKGITVVLMLAMSLGTVATQAQACDHAGKSCCKHGMATASTTSTGNTAVSDEALKMASLDPSIETRTADGTGQVYFVRKVSNPANGASSYTSVAYDSNFRVRL